MRARQTHKEGFSLVETIAAMGILALAAIPLMEVVSEATSNTGRLEVRTLARTVAENVLAREHAEPINRDGGIYNGSETQLGRTFTWTLQAGPAAPGELQSLAVTVTLAERDQILARLETLKTGPTPLVTTSGREEQP